MEGNNLSGHCCAAYLVGQANVEIARLRAELKRLSEQPTPLTSPSPIPTLEVLQPSLHCGCHDRLAVGDGSGCASPEIYRDMVRTNWHGRLGRAHMADVDNMHPAKRGELDYCLYHMIKEMFPRGAGITSWRKDTIFARLKDLGLRLEDRTAYADAPVFDDGSNMQASTISRMRNYSACFYDHSANWDRYWNGYALETLVELARYRGLFTRDGMLKESLAD